MIDLAKVIVVAGNQDVFSFPATARLESFGVVPGTMSLRTSGTGGWPAVDIDPSVDSSGDGNSTNDQDQAATLWVLKMVGSQWFAAGAERLRPSQVNGNKPNAHQQYGGLSTLIGNGWFGKSEFGPLNGANPKPGEVIGVMVVSGSTRLDGQFTLRERTGVLFVVWPDAGGANPMAEAGREGAVVTLEPVVQPPTTPQVPPVNTVGVGANEAMEALAVEIAENTRVLASIDRKLNALATKGDVAALRQEAIDVGNRVLTALQAAGGSGTGGAFGALIGALGSLRRRS